MMILMRKIRIKRKTITIGGRISWGTAVDGKQLEELERERTK
jgi:hypothetical protein